MVDFSLVQCCIVQSNIVQCDVVQFSLVYCSLVQCCVVQFSVLKLFIVKGSVVYYTLVKYGIMKYDFQQCCVVQYSLVQCMKCSIFQCIVQHQSTVQLLAMGVSGRKTSPTGQRLLNVRRYTLCSILQCTVMYCTIHIVIYYFALYLKVGGNSSSKQCSTVWGPSAVFQYHSRRQNGR